MAYKGEWEDRDQAFIGNCNQCKAQDVLVIWSDDPYTSEINPEADNPEEYWCCPCWCQRCADR